MNGIRIPFDALVLVGDGRKALFLRNKGDEANLNLVVEDVFEQENPASAEQGTDKAGSMNRGRPSSNRSRMEQTDWHQMAEDRFAKDIAGLLYRAAHAGRYERLVVVAPPKVLGELRKEVHKEVQARIIAEVDKTLTNAEVAEMERVLAGA